MQVYLVPDHNGCKKHSKYTSGAPKRMKRAVDLFVVFLLKHNGLCIHRNIEDPHTKTIKTN